MIYQMPQYEVAVPPPAAVEAEEAVIGAVLQGSEGLSRIGHLLTSDAFYDAEGRYNALFTSNNWAAAVLAEAGVRVPLWSPFSGPIIDQIRASTSN